MRLALLILFLLLPNAAHADPVTAIIAGVAAFAGGSAVVYTAAITVATAVYGASQARKAARQARDEANAALKDRMTNKVGTEAPHRYIYGRAKVGGSVVAMFTTGDKDQYRHIVTVHANHECDGIEEVFVNNVAVGVRSGDGDATAGRYAPDSNSAMKEEVKTGPTFTLAYTPLTGTVRAYKGTGAAMEEVSVSSVSGNSVTVGYTGTVTVVYARSMGRLFDKALSQLALPSKTPIVRVQIHLGGASDPVDTYLNSAVPSQWPATAVLRGMCYTVVTLDLNHKEFQNGQVPIHVLVRGKKLYDPRSSTTYWSTNPALAIYDYLTSPLCDVDAADLPVAEFITAANVCDEVVAGGPRYTINGDVSSDQSQASVLGKMAECMAGGLVSTTWSIYAGKYVAPVMALSQADIVGNVQMTPGASDADIYNGVKGQYVSAETKYVLTDFKPYQNAAYRADDARDLYTDIDFPFTDSLQRVTNLCRIFTEDQRNGFTMRAEFSLKAWPLKVGQRVTFTSELFGQTAKIYRITDKAFAPNSAVQLTLKEDAAEIWDFADAVVVDATPNTDLPDPWEILPLASISITSGDATLLRQPDGSTVPRMLVTWPLAPSLTVQDTGQVEIEWRAVGSTVWSTALVPGDATQAYLAPVTPGWVYVVRARCVNPYIGTQSNWVNALYQVQVFEARPVVYTWSATQPAPPDGTGTYTWSTEAYAAPSGWSLIKPTAPAGGNESLWEARALVTDISDGGSTQFQWPLATVSAIGYAPASAGTGPAGYSNARVFAYQRKATAPTGTPGAVNYDFTTATITTATLANGWLKTVPAADGNPLYVTSASASAAGTTDSIGSAEWSGAVVLAYDGGAGTPGLNNATVTLYQRTGSATAPAKPSATCTYTFATGVLTGVNNGWTTYIPSTGGSYLHTTFATAISATATDTIPTTEWAAVQLMYDATALIAAQAAADAANAKIDAISVDSVLDRSEKVELISAMDAAAARYTGLTAQATALGVSFAAFTAARNARDTYLISLDDGGEPAWDNITQNTAITRATFRTKFTDYSREEMALMNAIAAKSATLSTWSGVSGGGRPADNATADITLLPRGAGTATGNTIGRGGGTAGWNSDVYSVESYTGGVFVSATVAQYGVDVIFGMNDDPTTDASWEGITFAFYTDGSGTLHRMHNGSYIAVGTYAIGDVLVISYDGVTARWFRNGTQVASLVFSATAPLFFDSSFYTLNSKLNYARIGPLSSIAGLANRNGDTLTNTTINSPVINSPVITGAPTFPAFTLAALSALNGSSSSNAARTFGSRTATPTGGTGVITYTWTWTAIDGNSGVVSLSGDTTATVTVSGKSADGSVIGRVTCTARDDNGLVAVRSFNVNQGFGAF